MKALAVLVVALFAFGCYQDPVDPTQPPCGGKPVYFGQHCCHVNDLEWKCQVEQACGWTTDDCRNLEFAPLGGKKPRQ